MEKLKTELVAPQELERLKKLNQRDFIDRLRSNESVAGTLATLEVQAGWRYLNDYLRNMDAVTPEDIRRVARQYGRPENKTTSLRDPGRRGEPPARSLCGGSLDQRQRGCGARASQGRRFRTTRSTRPRPAGSTRCPSPATRTASITRKPSRWRSAGPRCFSCRTTSCRSST
ncbi:MAG: hypothetical protein MZV70_08650 [Desulfobacterales bacterium]|nr:hypothetical protein [Desulfobacterales bacterium]